MSAIEDAWLNYAQRLLHDSVHIKRCDALLGPEAVARADAADLRWPGYLGAHYEPGGLLLCALVHRNFASGRLPMPVEMVDEMVTVTRGWRDGAVSAEEWLAVLRTFYRAGLLEHWNVGWLIRALEAEGADGIESIAYVNTARCQIVENPAPVGHARAKRSVAEFCGRDYPLQNLCAILRPRLVLMTSKLTWDLQPEPLDTPVLVIDQRKRTVAVPFSWNGVALAAGTKAGHWVPSVVAALRP